MKKEKKKRISVAAAKAKGRNFQKWVAEKISKVTGIPCGKDCLIESREMGQNGVDVKLIGEALELYPFSVETKNNEAWSVHEAIKQAISNQKEGTYWQVFFTKNRYHKVVIMDAEAWFEIYDQFLNGENNEQLQGSIQGIERD